MWYPQLQKRVFLKLWLQWRLTVEVEVIDSLVGLNLGRNFTNMSYRRETRASKAGLFDGYDNIEEGGLRASSTDISENENEKALDSLKDRVFFLKQLSGDIHGEVLSHNRLLHRMGNEMDASRGILSGTLDRFKMVFERKSGRATCKLVGFLVAFFLLLYLFIRVLGHSM